LAVVTMKQLLESGVHFGHQARRWNPKMRRFIFMERNGIHIIDLQQTLTRVEEAYAFMRDLAGDGGQVLFVGTKKQAQESIAEEAKRAGMHYVNQRWLGGFLTNFVTIQKRIQRLNDLVERKERGDFATMPKKDAQRLEDELVHLDRYFSGVRELKRPPNALFVVDPHREHIAVDEARRLEVPVVAMVDTNCDPDLIDVIIPANDDAIRAVRPRPRTWATRRPQPPNTRPGSVSRARSGRRACTSRKRTRNTRSAATRSPPPRRLRPSTRRTRRRDGERTGRPASPDRDRCRRDGL